MGTSSSEKTLLGVSAGELLAFLQHLHRAGFTAEAIRAVNSGPAKAAELVKVAQDWLQLPADNKLVGDQTKPKKAITFPPWATIWDGATADNWLNRLIIREKNIREVHATAWDVGLFTETARHYGREQIEQWERKFLLRFSALPTINLIPEWAQHPDTNLDWWQVKPRAWFYDQVAAGKIGYFVDGKFQLDREAYRLRGEIVLIDTRLKPAYRDGRQMWESDELFCGKVLKQLRQVKTIPTYDHGPQSSRFSISANPDWQDYIRPALAEHIGLEPDQLRFERTVEANAISQFYPDLPRAQDGTADTWVWYEEYFVSIGNRLSGGSFDFGGLACVNHRSSFKRWRSRSFRPLGVLAG